MNKCIFIGRLTKDPESKEAGENKFARFTIAIDRRANKDGEKKADFIPCTAWNKTAEIVEKYCTKGKRVCVECEAQTNTVEKDGEKKTYYGFVVRELYLLDGGRKEGEQSEEDIPF